MRFDHLHLPAFGNFSDFSLKFPRSKYDVHLIHGENEAGKSSLLRAIHHLFYGIPTRSEDGFLHGNAKLLIGAGISEGDETFRFFRKKGNKNTLLDEERNTLPDEALAPFLSSVGEEFFRHMFGLNTESLREGAASLLSGKGDLGTAIFSASLGGSPIDEAIKSLETQAATLFKGTARKGTTILPAITDFKEAERASKAAGTTATAWAKLKKEIGQAQALFDEKITAHRNHRLRWQRVDHFLRALPVAASLRTLEGQLEEIALPDLPSDFSKRVRDLQEQIARHRQAQELEEIQIEKSKKALAEISDHSVLLENTAAIEQLHRQAEQEELRQVSLPALEVRLEGKELVKEVSPAAFAEVCETGELLMELTREHEQGRKNLAKLEISLAAQREELASLAEAADLTDLEDRVAEAETVAASLKLLPSLESELTELQVEEKGLRSRLEIPGDPREMKVAGVKTIQEQATLRETLREERRELKKDLAKLRDEQTAEETSLAYLASQTAIYSEADLVQARAERDSASAKDLPELIQKADEIVDTLRAHADQLAQAAAHQLKSAQLEAKQGNLKGDLSRVEEQFESWESDWKKRFAVLSEQDPMELLEWREGWKIWCENLSRTEVLEKEISSLVKSAGPDFSKTHKALRAAIKKATHEQGERKALAKALHQQEVEETRLKHELGELSEGLERVQKRWQTACKTANLDPALSPAVARETLSQEMELRELGLQFSQEKEASEVYQKLAKKTAKACGISLDLLHRELEKAKLQDGKKQLLISQLEDFQVKHPALLSQAKRDREALQKLGEQAGSHDFERVILQLEKRASLKTRLEEQRETLQSLAGHEELTEFLTQLETQDPVELSEEKSQLDEKEEALQQERDEAKALLDEKLREQNELTQASDTAAVEKQRAADALSTIVADSARYRQLHYAIAFLKQQVESYREKAQGPMIGKTSAFFRALTDGAFERVAAQLDEKDQPQLIAIRQGGEEVKTTGLSEGTADQLYLALRLAAIDLHLENHPPMPLILDDLLMTFDDARTAALMPVLEEFSKKTQILIFTHHAHLKNLMSQNVQFHELPPRS